MHRPNVEANPSLSSRAQQIDASSSEPREPDGKNEPIKTIFTDEERAARAEKARVSSIGKGLWEAAHAKIDKQRLDRLQRQVNDGDEKTPEELQDAVKQKINDIKDSRLKLKLRNGEVLQIRDGAMKVIRTILSYKDIITAAVASETHASLAWGGITALLLILSTALSQTDDALNDLDGISTLLIQYRAIEVTYDLSENPEERFGASDHIRKLHSQLRDQTIELYKEILERQIDLMDHYSHNKFRRAIQDIPSTSLGNFSKIQEISGDALKTLQMMDSVTIVDVDRQLVPPRSNFKEIMDRMNEVHKNVKV
ncbi:uncharacterized protein N7483_011320 [Penicillium malachiteum]|uniref:uncharacterized protein n=1 Tax=Penicillium malachiteum TaxID=1324776 RepID=UPI002546A653|nr:uncharacterized protein N7483_011320 [Penicillium malachiteum]KAJ5714139.1 hypothetical protein N7483_011320 [Penicillium malachiteum]